MSTLLKQRLLLALSLLAIAATMLAPSIPQNPEYHDFADDSRLLFIPNGLNVLSNLLFMWIGCEGLYRVLRRKTVSLLDGIYPAYPTFFAALILIALGSGYYHWSPDNQTLAWDRAAMTLAFASFFSIVLAERVSLRAARGLFPLLLVAGIGSILFWQYTESMGQGDLRPYALVQFLPLLLIPLILFSFKPRYSRGSDIWSMLAWYVAAKVVELLDHQVYATLGVISGHSLKHLCAGIGCYVFLRHLRLREPVT